jgi:hypothetical protein
MEKSGITITPKTKVGELLDNYPELEAILMQLSPAFEKLKNPVLRKTVARVATLQQISVVGGLNVDVIVSRLRKELGQSGDSEENTLTEYISSNIPEWLDKFKITSTYDATPVINSGGSPMAEILNLANALKPGEILELRSPFIPAPIIDLLKKKGYKVHCFEREKDVISYIIK